MALRESVPFLKGAVARSLPGGAPSVYIFNEGVMYAQSPALVAAYPVAHIMGTFGLAADDLEGAIGRMPTEPAVSAGDGTLILSAGRLRSTIQLFAAEMPEEAREQAATNEPWAECPVGLWPALALAQPFVSADGSWQRCVCLLDGRLLAMNNAAGIEVKCDDLHLSAPQAPLIDDAVEYLAKLPPPAEWREERAALSFRWPSGAWVRARLAAVEYSVAIMDRIFEGIGNGAAVPLTQEWRDALDDIRALAADGKSATVDLGPSGIVGRSAHGEHVAQFATGCERETRWAMRALLPVFGAAKQWCPDAHGAASFSGDGLRGAVVGMTR